MSKNVLILSSSPRRGGNSDLLCDEFAKGAAEAGNVVEKIFLGDCSIAFCTGCGACVEKQGFCTQKDDMRSVQEKMLKADVLVLASPIYFYAVSGQLKTLIDRSCAFYTLLKNKDFYYILSMAETDIQKMRCALAELGGFLECLDGAQCKGKILAAGVWHKEDVLRTEFPAQAYALGKSVK